MLSKIKAYTRLPMSPSSSFSLLLRLLLVSSTSLSFSQDAAIDLDCTTTFSSTNLSFSYDAATDPNCTTTFTCGSVTGITYPFSSAGSAPETCGPPEYRLTCHENHLELTTNSFTYRVIQINQDQQTIDLAWSDQWNNTCPREFHNPTLNPSIFTISNSANEDLTLIYGCNTTAMTPDNRFTCSVGGINSTDSYYLIGSVPFDPTLNILKCTYKVSLPILKTSADLLLNGKRSLGEALMMGFRVNYTNPYRCRRDCPECTRSGTRCGFNSSLGHPVCICDDSQCPQTGNGSNKRNTLTIVLPVVGAIVAGIAIGWLFFFCRQRRKRRAVQSAYQTESGRPSPLSSKPQTSTNPTTNLTRSIPSYPSTNTEFGKSDYFGLQVFTYAELEKATDNFDRSKELGDGGFGTVYYGKLVDGREVAVKVLYDNNFKRLEQFINEVEILTHLKHENLVKLYGCTSKRSRELLLVYEYISNGTVADHLHGKRPKSVSGLLSWPIRLNIAIETACALSYLHDSDIIHRDVKTNNILLDSNFRVKVADFGLSRLFPIDATHVSTAPQGTPGYVDPEYYQCYQLTDKSDVYSFGVVLIELLSSLEAVDTNRHRHHINLSNMAVDKIQNHLLHELVDKTIGFEMDNSVRRMATLVAELAFRCLQQDKDMRPTMKEVLEILKGIQNDQLNGQKPEILDIVVDNGAQTKDNASPPSPASSVTDRWVGSTPNSSG